MKQQCKYMINDHYVLYFYLMMEFEYIYLGLVNEHNKAILSARYGGASSATSP